MGILRPCHVAPASSIPRSSLTSSSALLVGPMPTFRPFPRKTQGGPGRIRHVLRHRRSASNQPCEPSPGDDPKADYYRIYRESLNKFETEYSAELRAKHGPKKNNMNKIFEDTFGDEKDKAAEYRRYIYSDKCFLDPEGRKIARVICIRAMYAIDLASKVMGHAGLRAHNSSEISLHTVERTIRIYVSAFLKIAEEACHKKVDKTTIISFLGSLGGLAAVSHILFQDALVTANNIEGSSSNYSPDRDVEADNHEFQRKMINLETKFVKTSRIDLHQVMCSLNDAIAHATSFIIITINRRKDAILHIQEITARTSHVVPDDKEPDGS